MALLRVDTAHLLPVLRRSLVALVGDLDAGAWRLPTACPGWSVGDVAGHLLGVELANVSRRRDGHRVDPAPGDAPGAWLAAFNDDWVRAARRRSPPVVAGMLDLAGSWFEQHVAGLDLDAIGGSVWWVGPEPAPVWLDVAREYTERWVHQQQIRDATDRPGLRDARYVGPVVATFVHVLPRSLAGVDAAEGTTVDLSLTGEGGGEWHARRGSDRWSLEAGPSPSPACRLTGPVDDAWRLYADYSGATLAATGDDALAAAAGRGRAIIA